MSNVPYGMTALFEAMKHSQRTEAELEEVTSIMCGVGEAFTAIDAEEVGFISDNEVENDMDVAEDELSEEELEELCDKIRTPGDDEDEDNAEDMEILDEALESFIDSKYM